MCENGKSTKCKWYFLIRTTRASDRSTDRPIDRSGRPIDRSTDRPIDSIQYPTLDLARPIDSIQYPTLDMVRPIDRSTDQPIWSTDRPIDRSIRFNTSLWTWFDRSIRSNTPNWTWSSTRTNVTYRLLRQPRAHNKARIRKASGPRTRSTDWPTDRSTWATRTIDRSTHRPMTDRPIDSIDSI